MALHDENVRTTDAFTESRAYLAVGKFNQVVLSELDAQIARNFLGESRMRTARVQGHALGCDFVNLAQRGPPLMAGIQIFFESAVSES